MLIKPLSRPVFTPSLWIGQTMGQSNGKGPREILSLVHLFQNVKHNVAMVNQLAGLASKAPNIRTRYTALLLLDKLLVERPELKTSSCLAPVREELADLALDRAAKTKRLMLTLLPKTDLHVHVDGSVRVETVVDLAQKQGVDLAAVLEASKATPGKSDFLKDVPSLPKKPTVDQIRCLSQIKNVQPDFLKMLFLGFDFAIAVMQTKEALTRTAFELVEDSAREGVMHLTAIFAPCLHTAGGLSYQEIAEGIIDGLEKGREIYGVTWELSPAVYRGVYTELFPDHLGKTVELVKLLAAKHPGQIAFDVVGAEFQMPLADFRSQYETLKGNGVILRGHAGETLGSAENIMTAYELGLDRIGHGIRLMDLSRADIRKIIDSGVVFEVSPVSNAKCYCIGENDSNVLENHPVRQMLEAGASIALCTDDRAVFDVNNVGQLINLEQAFSWQLISRSEITKFGQRLLSSGFNGIAEPGLRQEHLLVADQYFRAINQLLGVLA